MLLNRRISESKIKEGRRGILTRKRPTNKIALDSETNRIVPNRTESEN